MKYIILFLLILGLNTSFAQRPLPRTPVLEEIRGEWDWMGANNTFIFFSNNYGYKKGISKEDKDVGLTYELIDPECKLYKVRWFSKSTGQVWFVDYLVLKYGNNTTYLEGISKDGVFVRAFKKSN